MELANCQDIASPIGRVTSEVRLRPSDTVANWVVFFSFAALVAYNGGQGHPPHDVSFRRVASPLSFCSAKPMRDQLSKPTEG